MIGFFWNSRSKCTNLQCYQTLSLLSRKIPLSAFHPAVATVFPDKRFDQNITKWPYALGLGRLLYLLVIPPSGKGLIMMGNLLFSFSQFCFLSKLYFQLFFWPNLKTSWRTKKSQKSRNIPQKTPFFMTVVFPEWLQLMKTC